MKMCLPLNLFRASRLDQVARAPIICFIGSGGGTTALFREIKLYKTIVKSNAERWKIPPFRAIILSGQNTIPFTLEHVTQEKISAVE